MRDPKRIKPLLKRIEDFWIENPDWRLCQIICNAISACGFNEDVIFYIEDDIIDNGLFYLAAGDKC